MKSFVVEAAEAGQRLDVVLAGRFGISRNQAATSITQGRVTIDGEPASKQQRLRSGQRIEFAVDEDEEVAPPRLPAVRWEDEHLLVLAKPAGLVVHPGAGHHGDTLVDALQAAEIPLAKSADPHRPGIVHRLDRETSGLMVVAKSDAAYHGLVEQLAQRQVTRRYIACTVGVPQHARGRIEGPIGRDPSDRVRFAIVASGRPAVTRYRLLATGEAPVDPPHPIALLHCQLETGRTHQIRVHLSALGHPIVGDPIYSRRRAVARALGVQRPLLHATELRFVHPVTEERIEVHEPWPQDLVDACRRAAIDTEVSDERSRSLWDEDLTEDPPSLSTPSDDRS